MIQLDTRKSPAVTFATLENGTVLACEPDGSRLIGASSLHRRNPVIGVNTVREALACVALAYAVRR